MYRIISFFIVIFLTIAFAYQYQGVNKMTDDRSNLEILSRVDIKDGINKKEAVLIAKHYLVKNDYEQNCIMFFALAKNSTIYENTWAVYFFPRLTKLLITPFRFVVYIDKKTGRVKNAGWNK